MGETLQNLNSNPLLNPGTLQTTNYNSFVHCQHGSLRTL